MTSRRPARGLSNTRAVLGTDVSLSVVIPTFDTASMTLRCCRAVLASSIACEVIVADDGSRDGTAELIAKELPRVRVVRLDENRGFATAANRGVAETQGSIVMLLNSDATVEADALRAIVAAFDDDSRLGVAGARLLNEDGTPQWSGGRTPTLLWMIGVVSGLGPLARFFRRRRSGGGEIDWVSGAAMAFRREVWNAAGPLSERYRFYCQDIDFCLDARDAGWKVRVIESARVTHALGKTIGPGRRRRLRDDLLTFGRARYGHRWAFFARLVLGGQSNS